MSAEQRVVRRFVLIVPVMLFSAGAGASRALANGLIISPVAGERPNNDSSLSHSRPIHRWMPFQITSQSVNVEVNEAVAETTVEQTFANRSGGQQEGQYLFPIAEDAGVGKFTMWMNGREVAGELLDADRARQIYESIVAQARDPGLLQFAGRGLIQAKVFPIPSGGECRIRLRYTEPVKVDGGLLKFSFPLGSSGCQFQPIEQFSLRAAVRTQRPLVSVFSPSHTCSIDRRGDRETVVGFEKAHLTPDADFQLFAQLGTEPFGVSLLPYRLGEEDGFFMARIAPRLGSQQDAVLPKNICFVLDTSGSMADSNKIGQAKKALQFCVTNLNKLDRFNIISFSTEVRPFRDGWSAADESAKQAAREHIDSLNAVGGTDINGALAKALEMRPVAREGGEPDWTTNPYLVVFITDGEPTVGVTDPDQIVRNFSSSNSSKTARLFSLGVGFQVDTKLLDRLSDDNGGARDYVTPTEDLELKISSFYTKLANPILANVKLVIDGVTVHDMYPRRLADMFEGSELVVVGRYSGAKETARLTLSGDSRGDRRTFEFAGTFPRQDTQHEFLPRLWAMRKIGFLLDELRLRGETGEVKNEVIRLSKLYGVLTPYTSYLVQEDEELAQRERRQPTGGHFLPAPMSTAMGEKKDKYAVAAAGQKAAVGSEATKQSQDNRSMCAADSDDAEGLLAGVVLGNCDSEGRQLLNFVGAQTFYLENDRWVDAAYDGKSETRKLILYSKDYYDVLKKDPQLGASFAQGERVVVKQDGRFIETVRAESGSESLKRSSIDYEQVGPPFPPPPQPKGSDDDC
ncbi:MAG TPA: VIT and VWA domain-containing protein [Phycisphaerae bacterium]|nr:VIT and VWA domain-containing protein [Phycisphaerae bacterium]